MHQDLDMHLEFIDKVKEHLKNNWGKYALAAGGAYAYSKLANNPENQKALGQYLSKSVKNASDTVKNVYHNSVDAVKNVADNVKLDTEEDKQTKK